MYLYLVNSSSPLSLMLYFRSAIFGYLIDRRKPGLILSFTTSILEIVSRQVAPRVARHGLARWRISYLADEFPEVSQPHKLTETNGN